MRILLLASRIPYPLDNGEDLRIFHFARHLAMNHELHFIGYGLKEQYDRATVLFKTITTTEKKPVRQPDGKTLSRMIKALSPEEMYVFDPEICDLLKKRLREDRFDLIWIPAWGMVPYVYSIPDIPVFIDVMDDGVLEHYREVRQSKNFLDVLLKLKGLVANYRFERKYFQRASVCCLVSEKDAEVLNRVCPKVKSLVIHNGVDLEFFHPLNLPEEFPSLIFEGNMNFPPSVDAILYFCSEIFPHILKEIPQTKIYIVGKNPTPAVQSLSSDNIIVTGYVNDVRPFLDQASVFVCPMRKGAGIKNKVLQAWAMAKPVVATPISCGGLLAKSGENLLISEKPLDFASKVIELLRDKEKRCRLGKEGLGTVSRHYSWKSKSLELENAFYDTLGSPSNL